MSFSKISQIALYIVMGISVLVLGFFYFGENLIDMDAYNAKVEKLNAPDTDLAFNYMQDLAIEEVDSLATESDSTEMVTSENEAGIEPAAVEEVAESTSDEVKEDAGFNFMQTLIHHKTGIALVWAYILVGITLLVVVGFSLVQMFSNTKALVKSLIVLAAVAVLVGLAYMLGSDVPMDITGYEGTDSSNPKVLKLVDMGLISTYFMLGLLLLSILATEVTKYFKK